MATVSGVQQGGRHDLRGSAALALEAECADCRAVLAAIDPLRQNQRAHGERTEAVETRLDAVETRLETVESKLDATGRRARSLEDNLAEVKDLLIRALGR